MKNTAIKYVCFNLLSKDVILSTNISAIIKFMDISRPTFARINKGQYKTLYKHFVIFNEVGVSKCNYKGRF